MDSKTSLLNETKDTKESNNDIDKYTMKDYQKAINNYLSFYINNEFPKQLQSMIKYIVSDGKRLRSIIFLLFGNIDIVSYLDTASEANYKTNLMMDLAIAVELIHCLSLVIDDSPSMDNDNFRRGKESFHKKYGLMKTNIMIYYLFNKIILMFGKYVSNNSKITSSNIKLIDMFQTNMNRLLEGQCLEISI